MRRLREVTLVEVGRARRDAPGSGSAAGCLRAGGPVGELIYSSGQLPIVEGRVIVTGKVGGAVSLEQAEDCARTAALNALAAVAGRRAIWTRSPR